MTKTLKRNAKDILLDSIIPVEFVRCERCNQPLTPGRALWLELNSHTGRWTRHDGECPPAESQGWFSFGLACAKVQLAMFGEE